MANPRPLCRLPVSMVATRALEVLIEHAAVIAPVSAGSPKWDQKPLFLNLVQCAQADAKIGSSFLGGEQSLIVFCHH